jgi:mono/diheme cytochrome c family protein
LPVERAGWGAVEVSPEPDDLTGLRGRGEALARELCADCHGLGGRGDGVLAEALPRLPRDLSGRLRTRTGAIAADVYRTLTAGAPRFGMPSFERRSSEERWALVAWVLAQGPGAGSAKGDGGAPLPPRPGVLDLHLGQDVYRAHCLSCHGELGRGGEVEGLVDAAGEPCPPTVFAEGPAAFRAGARAEDVAAVVWRGRPETPMAAFALEPEQLWAVAAYVAKLAELGAARRRAAWDEHFRARATVGEVTSAVADQPPRRFKKRRSRRFAQAPEGRAGCLACHEGIEAFSAGAMGRALAAVAGGDPDRECAVCHEGDPLASTKVDAHRGLVGNPGSLWVTGLGAGCAKCHSRPGSLTTLMGRSLPEPVGGRLMHATSAVSDPTGATSGDYTYRVQRSLMGQESGKAMLVARSAGLDPTQPWTDFPLVDPDGADPCVGSPAYRGWMAEALAQGYVERIAASEGIPSFPDAAEQVGVAAAAVVDYGRKACFRCHLWGEGQATRGEHRSAGCSACHVVYGPNAFTQSGDPTIPPRTAGHPERHVLATFPPDAQCNHCHTRNPLTQGTDPHEVAGLACVDCHTSIDVHGDGNAYPHMEHQVEVRCQDCHGEGDRKPWELPLGHTTPVAGEGPRGIHRVGGQEHLLTNRGNPRTNWLREGDQVVVRSFRTGARHVVPAARDARPPAVPAEPGSAQAGCTQHLAGHEALACSLCHNRKGPRCGTCHMTYLPYTPTRDWLLSAFFYDPATARQGFVLTPGEAEFEASDPPGEVPFGAPDTRIDRAGRRTPREAGCQVVVDYLHEDGSLERYVPRFNPGTPSYPPPVANTLPHENALRPRGCAECHPEGTDAPVRLFGHVEGR